MGHLNRKKSGRVTLADFEIWRTARFRKVNSNGMIRPPPDLEFVPGTRVAILLESPRVISQDDLTVIRRGVKIAPRTLDKD